MCFAGVLSSGYWQRPDLTARHFVQHPQLGLLYRTGDLGRWQNQEGYRGGELRKSGRRRGVASREGWFDSGQTKD